MVVLLSNARKKTIAGVILRVLEIHGFAPLGNQTNKPIPRSEANFVHQLLIQSFGCTEHIPPAGGLAHIHAAHLCAHGIAHPAHHNFQCFIQAAGRVDLLNNVTQRFKHGGLPACLVVSMTTQRSSQLLHRTAIDLALERDDLIQGIPVTNPLPLVEFRFVVEIQLYRLVIF